MGIVLIFLLALFAYWLRTELLERRLERRLENRQDVVEQVIKEREQRANQ